MAWSLGYLGLKSRVGVGIGVTVEVGAGVGIRVRVAVGTAVAVGWTVGSRVGTTGAAVGGALTHPLNTSKPNRAKNGKGNRINLLNLLTPTGGSFP